MLAVINDDAHGYQLLLWVLWCPYNLRVSWVLPKAMNQFCSVTARCDDFTMVVYNDRTVMRKTDCFGKTRLVLHVPSSS